MAGLTIDDRMPRVISTRTHFMIDCIHVARNFLMAAVFRRRRHRNIAASNAALALGASSLANALMTDYERGILRLYSFKVHGMLDYGVAAASAAMPVLLGFHDTPEAKFFYIQAAGETAIAGVSDYDDESGSQRHHADISRYRVHRAA